MNQFSKDSQSKFRPYFLILIAVVLSIIIIIIFLTTISSNQRTRTINTNNQSQDEDQMVQNDNKNNIDEDNTDNQSKESDNEDKTTEEDTSTNDDSEIQDNDRGGVDSEDQNVDTKNENDDDAWDEDKTDNQIQNNDQERSSNDVQNNEETATDEEGQDEDETTYVRYLAIGNTRNCDLNNFNSKPNQATDSKKSIAAKLSYYHSVFGTSLNKYLDMSRDDYIKVLKDHLFKTGQGNIQKPLKDFTKDFSNRYMNHNYISRNAPWYNKNYYDVYLNALKDLDDYVIGYCFKTNNNFTFKTLNLNELNYITNNYQSKYSASEFKNPMARKQEILDDITKTLGLTENSKRILNSINSIEFSHNRDFDPQYRCDGCWHERNRAIQVKVGPIYDGWNKISMRIFVHEFLHAIFSLELKDSSDRDKIFKELIKLYFSNDALHRYTRFNDEVNQPLYRASMKGGVSKTLQWLNSKTNLSDADYYEIGFSISNFSELHSGVYMDFNPFTEHDFNTPVLDEYYSQYFKDWRGLRRRLYSYNNIEQSESGSIINKLTDYVLRGNH